MPSADGAASAGSRITRSATGLIGCAAKAGASRCGSETMPLSFWLRDKPCVVQTSVVVSRGITLRLTHQVVPTPVAFLQKQAGGHPRPAAWDGPRGRGRYFTPM